MTPRTGPNELVINTRTLRIGHQTYQLSNLARVQTITLPPPPDEGQGNKGLAWGVGALAFAVVVLPLDSATGDAIPVLWLLICIGLGAFVYHKTRVHTQPQHALMLETTGAPFVALVSNDHSELIRVSDFIVDAIENPPEGERHITVNNVHYGDRIRNGDRITQQGGLNLNIGEYRNYRGRENGT